MRKTTYTKRELRARVRETRLAELGYASYADYMRSAAWRDVKARYRASDLPQICMCGEAKVDMHHTTYERVGRERLEDLIPLCRRCHDQAHALEAAGVIDLDLAGFYYDPERATKSTAERAAHAAEVAPQVGVELAAKRAAHAQKRHDRAKRRTPAPPADPTARLDRRRELQRRREPTPARPNRVSQ